ncbi:hypothetical protein PHYBOEH_006366 [Phytophthora boehmeriae]|uniref:Uncharacterized protein n=1 Tax=Phytophthora boehmeriae TaxID=109152 RepID=A0A8T1WGY0_9STRA|nr:hypothetical protein PHYBOEH_006366 [Phytophthora boehmeriae]
MGSCSELCAGLGLFVFNGVDLVAGVALCIYSLYIGTNHYAPWWLYVLASLMSGCGLVFRRFSGCMALSSDMLQWLSLAELGLAIVVFTQGDSIDKFLREHQNQLELSGDQLSQLERHKYYPGYLLVVLFFMETLRRRYSTTLHHARLRRQYEYEMLA